MTGGWRTTGNTRPRLALGERADRRHDAQPLPGALPPLGVPLRPRAAPADRALHPLGLERSPPYAQVVWGGDPTTGWGFDGLRSSVIQALTMGLSGISLWGSDVGGFFTLSEERLTPELLARWIQFGAVSGVMRTKAGGSAPPRPSGRRSGSRGCCRSGGATRAPHPAVPVPPRRRRRVPPDRPSDHAAPRPRLPAGPAPWPPTTSCCSAPTCSRRRSHAQGSDGGACTSRAATGSTSGARSATSAAPAAWPSAARGAARRARRDAAGAARRAAAARARGRSSRSCRPTWTRSPPTAPAS